MLNLLTTRHATTIRFSICVAQHLRSAASAVVFGCVAPDSWRWRPSSASHAWGLSCPATRPIRTSGARSSRRRQTPTTSTERCPHAPIPASSHSSSERSSRARTSSASYTTTKRRSTALARQCERGSRQPTNHRLNTDHIVCLQHTPVQALSTLTNPKQLPSRSTLCVSGWTTATTRHAAATFIASETTDPHANHVQRVDGTLQSCSVIATSMPAAPSPDLLRAGGRHSVRRSLSPCGLPRCSRVHGLPSSIERPLF